MNFNQSIYDFLVEAIRLVVAHNHIASPDGKLYLQLLGLAMGSGFSANYATLWLALIEDDTLRRWHAQVIYAGRYADDAFHILHDLEEGDVRRFCASLYADTPKLAAMEWTIVRGGTGEAVFLDMRIALRDAADSDSVEVWTATHQKPINTYPYLAAMSYHPRSTLTAWIGSEAARYLRLSSTREEYESLLARFRARLLRRGYQADAVDMQLAKHVYSGRDALLDTLEKRGGRCDGHDRYSDDMLPAADNTDDDPERLHIVLQRTAASERAAATVRVLADATLQAVAPQSWARGTRAMTVWQLPTPLGVSLGRKPKADTSSAASAVDIAPRSS